MSDRPGWSLGKPNSSKFLATVTIGDDGVTGVKVLKCDSTIWRRIEIGWEGRRWRRRSSLDRAEAGVFEWESVG